MPSIFPELSSLGFFYSCFVLHQLLVPLQPPETWQKQQTLSSLPPTHEPKASHESSGLSLPAIFLFCQCHSCDSNTWFVCMSHHRQLSWHRKTPFHKKGARRDSKAATNSISHSSLKASHSHPKPGTLLTCFPIWGGCFYNQNTATLPTNVQRTNTTWAYVCL